MNKPIPNEEALEERPSIEELVGESEHTVEEAAIEERAPSGWKARGPSERRVPELAPEDLARHALEEATEAPVERPAETHVPLRGPLD